jgi:predicted amidophosphoribosyltransferase
MSEEKKFCPVCDAELSEEDIVCPSCGALIEETAYDAISDEIDEDT